MTDPSLLSLERLNAASVAQFSALLAGTYEHSPWIAERAAARRPFVSLAALKRALVEVVRESGLEAQLGLQGMCQMGGLAKAVTLIRVAMIFHRHAATAQGRHHALGLRRQHHSVQAALEEDQRRHDAFAMQQWCTRLIALGMLLRVAEQPVKVITFELMGAAPQA